MAPPRLWGWETILKAIAIFMATKWVTDVTKSISIVTKDMRTLGKVTAATGFKRRGRYRKSRCIWDAGFYDVGARRKCT
ncbi:hypothetical protein ECZC03_48700 [Escherichia coli]|nr:hypothetical protein ECZC03_48700 [Escherichia coli]